jgi:hypothetical protein
MNALFPAFESSRQSKAEIKIRSPAARDSAYPLRVKTLVCPHCDSTVSGRARVCTGCGAEIVRGATRRERSLIGIAFVVAGIVIATVALRAVEIGQGAMPLPDPRSDSAFLYFLGMVALVAFSYTIGKGVARFARRSQVRFFRSYRHH